MSELDCYRAIYGKLWLDVVHYTMKEWYKYFNTTKKYISYRDYMGLLKGVAK